jgi:hypothetical protein
MGARTRGWHDATRSIRTFEVASHEGAASPVGSRMSFQEPSEAMSLAKSIIITQREAIMWVVGS